MFRDVRESEQIRREATEGNRETVISFRAVPVPQCSVDIMGSSVWDFWQPTGPAEKLQ